MLWLIPKAHMGGRGLREPESEMIGQNGSMVSAVTVVSQKAWGIRPLGNNLPAACASITHIPFTSG